jgi:hypothetical protein
MHLEYIEASKYFGFDAENTQIKTFCDIMEKDIN